MQTHLQQLTVQCLTQVNLNQTFSKMYNSSAVLKVLATSAVNMVLEHAHSVVKNYCSGEVHSLEYSFGEVF